MKKFQVHFTGSRNARDSALTTVSASGPEEAAAIVARQISKSATALAGKDGGFIATLDPAQKLTMHEFTLTEVPA